MESRIMQVSREGQAVWLDFISRSFIEAGKLGDLVKQGLRGVTSNPTILERAISQTGDYDREIEWLARWGISVVEVYEALVIEDIRLAADALRPVYDITSGVDGYVSMEVDPHLAYDTRGSLAEAQRLFVAVDRPNLLIKIPATPAGLPAIEGAIAAGINVNATLIFSITQYERVAQAYLAGLERLAESGGDLGRLASVASFFVSRVDTVVDELLKSRQRPDLMGKTAIDNARLTYRCFKEIFSGRRWAGLARRGARVQRPLWASTGTKNPDYPVTLYPDNLVGTDTISTMPLPTLRAFQDHGRVTPALEDDLDGAKKRSAVLDDLGIELTAITDQLQRDGVAGFARSHIGLLTSIQDKSGQRMTQSVSGWR